jgi:hypothetical protein
VPQPVEIDGLFYEEKLIHRTSRREMVRSKSEVIIADRLAAHGIDYTYEQPLTIGNVTKYPDFTRRRRTDARLDEATGPRSRTWRTILSVLWRCATCVPGAEWKRSAPLQTKRAEVAGRQTHIGLSESSTFRA